MASGGSDPGTPGGPADPGAGGGSTPGTPGGPGVPGSGDDGDGDGGNPGDGGGPPGGGGGDDGSSGSYHTYTCGVIAFCPEMADYTTYTPAGGYGGFLLSYSCRSYESCQGDSGDGGAMDPPCEPTIGSGGVEMECDGDGQHGFDWGYYIKVWAHIPPHRMEREPFPRGIITVPNEFDLYPEPWISEAGGPHFGGDGFYSDKVNMPDPVRAEPKPGNVKDYEIGVRWRRVGDEYPGFGTVPPHCFDFDDRSWNVAAGAPPGACGRPEGDGHIRVAHAYETSFWDKPANGPRVDLENRVVPDLWDLESYQVKVPTYWVVEWRDRWYAWEVVGVEWGECGCWGTGEPTGEPHRRRAAGRHLHHAG